MYGVGSGGLQDVGWFDGAHWAHDTCLTQTGCAMPHQSGRHLEKSPFAAPVYLVAFAWPGMRGFAPQPFVVLRHWLGT